LYFAMMTGTKTTKLSVTNLILISSGVMASGCGTGPQLVIEASTTTCGKDWTIQREYNQNADYALCAAACVEHSDCTHFSLSEAGTCVTYRGCGTLRTAGQEWDTYSIVEPCDTTTGTADNGDDDTADTDDNSQELVAPTSPQSEVQVALTLVQQLEGVLENIEKDLENGLAGEAPAGGDANPALVDFTDLDVTAPQTQPPTETITPPPTNPPTDSPATPVFTPTSVPEAPAQSSTVDDANSLCEDTEASCPVLASFGYCDYFDVSMRENMQKNCPKSCNTCPGDRRRSEGTLGDASTTSGDASTTMEEAVTQMAVQAGFRYKNCIKEAPFGGFAKSTLVAWSPAIMGDLMDFSKERRRWGFNKNNFIVNIAEPIEEQGVTCENMYQVCNAKAMIMFMNGLGERETAIKNKYNPFVDDSNIEYFRGCGNAEISAICADFKAPLCSSN